MLKLETPMWRILPSRCMSASAPSASARRSSLSAFARSLGSPQMLPLSMSLIAPNPMRLTLSSPSFIGQLAQHRGKSERHARHAFVVKFFRCIAGQVVMRIAVKRGVGHHDRRVAVLAEGPVVRPRDPRDHAGRGHAFGWKLRVLPEGGDRPPYQGARAQVADEADEVGAVRVEPAERRRVMLAAGSVAVVAQ